MPLIPATHVVLTQAEMVTIIDALNFYQEEGIQESGSDVEHRIVRSARASVASALHMLNVREGKCGSDT